MSGKGANVGVSVDNISAGRWRGVLRCCRNPPRHESGAVSARWEGNSIQAVQGGSASAASRKAAAHLVVKEQAYSKEKAGGCCGKEFYFDLCFSK